MINLAITGGGTEAIPALLKNGGGSKLVNEIVVPYSCEATDKLIGYKPKKYCCEKTALDMAVAMGKSGIASFACNAQLRRENFVWEKHSDGSPREHKAYFSYYSLEKDKIRWYSTEYDIPGFTRQEQETHVSDLFLDFIYHTPKEDCDELDLELGSDKPELIYSGSFNPPHEGHFEIAKIAEKITKRSLQFEISITNYSKGNVNPMDLYMRQHDLLGEMICNVVFTNAPTYIEKIKLFPNSIFVVGMDTLMRMHDANLDALIDLVKSTNVSFLAFERQGCPFLMKDNQIPKVNYVGKYKDKGYSSTQIRSSLQ